MPVLILAGDEEFEIARRVNQLKEKLLDPQWATLNLTKLHNPSLQEVSEACGLLSLTPGNRIVLVNNCELFSRRKSKTKNDTSDSSEKSQKTMLDQFDKALSSVSNHTYVIFACTANFDSTLKLSKVALKHAKVENFSKQRYYPDSQNAGLKEWCRKEAASLGATISDDAVTYLLESTEGELRQIATEIKKACTYLHPDNKITLAAVTELSPHSSHLFTLIEHWIQGNHNQMIGSLEEVLSQQSGIPIIATLHTMLSRWITMQATVQELAAAVPGRPGAKLSQHQLTDQLAQELKLNPFIVKRELSRIKNFKIDQLISKQIELTRLEKQVKSGLIPDRHALTIFFSGTTL